MCVCVTKLCVKRVVRNKVWCEEVVCHKAVRVCVCVCRMLFVKEPRVKGRERVVWDRVVRQISGQESCSWKNKRCVKELV